MKVSEAMSRAVNTISPEQTICDAAKMMAECDVGILPVAENDRLVGMITDRDIAIRAVGENQPPDCSVRDIMSKQVLYCFEDEDIDHVARNMGDQKVRRLPVVSRDKRLVGIVSLGDISQKADANTARSAMSEITQPSGVHNQSESLH